MKTLFLLGGSSVIDNKDPRKYLFIDFFSDVVLAIYQIETRYD